MMVSPNSFVFRQDRNFGSRNISVNYGADGTVQHLTDQRAVVAQLPSGEAVPVSNLTLANTETPTSKAMAAAKALRAAQGTSPNPINELIIDRGMVKWKTAGQTDPKYNVLPIEKAEATDGLKDVLAAAQNLSNTDRFSIVHRITDKINASVGSLLGRLPMQVEL